MQLSAQPSFQFWIRRSDDLDAPYALRFKVEGGRGLLRVAHPDVLLDPPASGTGLQEGLTAPVIRASRFLLVSDGGKRRTGFFLAALGDGLLDRLPIGAWVELTPRVAGDMRLLLPLGRVPEASPPEDDPGEDDDLVTHPGEGTSEFHRVREVLRAFNPDLTESPADEGDDAPVLHERTWGRDDPREVAADHTDPSIGSDLIFVGGGTEDEARALVGTTLLASASMFDLPASAPAPAPEPDPIPSAPAPTGAPATPAAPPRIELDEAPFGPNRAALVRHLRRGARRDQDQIEQLKSRVAELERLLAEARAGATPGGEG